jgi:hypothetical protein
MRFLDRGGRHLRLDPQSLTKELIDSIKMPGQARHDATVGCIVGY